MIDHKAKRPRDRDTKSSEKASKTPAISSNWNKLKETMSLGSKRRKFNPEEKQARKPGKPEKPVYKLTPQAIPADDETPKLTQILALDCEMVGIGDDGKKSVLAQVCIVNYNGEIVYCKHSRPVEYVTDFRTWVSGIHKSDFREADPFPHVQQEVSEIIKGRIVVGHALSNDFKALMLSHPRHLIRDTADYPLFRRKGPHGKTLPQKLKMLVKQHLSLEIQEGEHSPADDAIAALMLYKKFRNEWEKQIIEKQKRKPKEDTSKTAEKPKKGFLKRKFEKRRKYAAAAMKKNEDEGPVGFTVTDD